MHYSGRYKTANAKNYIFWQMKLMFGINIYERFLYWFLKEPNEIGTDYIRLLPLLYSANLG